MKYLATNQHISAIFSQKFPRDIRPKIKYLDVGPQAQLPPPYAEDIGALLTMALS